MAYKVSEVSMQSALLAFASKESEMNAITKNVSNYSLKIRLITDLLVATNGTGTNCSGIAGSRGSYVLISGQNVDSEEHVSTSKAVVEPGLKNGIRLTEVLANHCTKHATLLSRCLASAGSAG